MRSRRWAAGLIAVAAGLCSSPRHALSTVLAVLRGTAYAVYYRLATRGAVVIRLPFLAFERVSISGPGRVEIGSSCGVHPNVFRGLNIVTLTPAARVTIGRRCALGGLTIRAARSVVIGDRTMTAYSLVQDTLFCARDEAKSVNVHRNLVEPIVIGRNVWLASSSCILSGTTLGDDSVVSQGACTLRASVDPFALVAGNLPSRNLPIRRLIELRGGV